MRVRFWVLIAAIWCCCAGDGWQAVRAGSARGPANTPVPTKTLRPTFTPTVPKPTLTPSPWPRRLALKKRQRRPASRRPGQQPHGRNPRPDAPPPTEAPSPTPEPAAFTVNSASVNVRSGPGTGFAVIGRLTQGQTFPITGKSENGDWWQFDYNGKRAGSSART